MKKIINDKKTEFTDVSIFLNIIQWNDGNNEFRAEYKRHNTFDVYKRNFNADGFIYIGTYETNVIPDGDNLKNFHDSIFERGENVKVEE